MLNSEQKLTLAQNSEKAERLLKLLANRYRLSILCALSEGEMSVGELELISDLSQSALSQHLAKLRDDKLVSTDKRGQMVYYRIASVEVNAILSVLYLIYCNK
jgi:DNA-binding transcriptional ArsR family regulator